MYKIDCKLERLSICTRVSIYVEELVTIDFHSMSHLLDIILYSKIITIIVLNQNTEKHGLSHKAPGHETLSSF